jgi:hypothetical protein
MKEEFRDNKIRVVKPHAQGACGLSNEIVIPREFCVRYGIDKDVHLMLIPEEDFFKVMKLRFLGPGEEVKE